MREPRVDPQPGDVVGGPVVKAKVVAIERRETESGMEVSVGYICAGRNVEFKTNWPPVTRPLEFWITFAKNTEVIHATPGETYWQELDAVSLRAGAAALKAIEGAKAALRQIAEDASWSPTRDDAAALAELEGK